MSRFADDSLGTVVNVEGSGGRATTPQMKRATSRRQRQTTPQRAGSAPRSSSASKVSSLAKACFEAQSCNRSLSRTAGRKKQQKWENDNLFGLNMFMKKVYALNKQRYESDDDWDEDGDATGVSQGPSLSWQSIFCTLTNGENEDALETYLKCSNSYRVKRAGESKSVRDCYSEWDRAEFAWLKVEKRLRTILLKSLVSVEAQEFVTAVEALLLCLEARHQGTETESPVVPPTCAHLFASPPRLVKPSTTESVRCRESEGEDVVVSVAAPHLVVTLMDSAFHRLLLHATCQFHNMHSKSFNDKKRGGARATRISPFQSQKCRHTISLVPFVLLKLSTAEEENDKSKSKVKRTNKKNKDKANTSGNATSDVVDQKSTECADVNTISLEDLTLEEKASTDGDAQVQNGEMPPVANGSSSVPRVENAADLGTESPSDDDDEDDSDDDEYCLVGLVSS